MYGMAEDDLAFLSLSNRCLRAGQLETGGAGAGAGAGFEGVG